ncbi:MAG: hypothetical protein QF475_00110, partial [Candidatus Undinarchaeales archaeon]|nr:hypothetical protein [Candidatus Undinarchaeales archaeon]
GSSSAVPVDEEEEELENEVPVEVPDGQCHEFDVLNLRVQGQVVDKDGKTFNDMCINGDTARKYFCDGNIKSFANYECPGSTKCDLDDRNDGICR